MLRGVRYLSLLLFSVWFGGIVFYGSVVVPSAHEVLGGHREIGFVTRRVTGTANLLGVATLALLAIEAWISRTGRSRPQHWAVVGTLSAMILAQGLLFLLRSRLDGFLDPEGMKVSDRAAFLWLHERYLNVTSLQCLAGAVHLCLMLRPPSRAPNAPSP